MIKARKNQISGGQLLCLLVLVRLSSLMLCDSVSYVNLLAELAVSSLLSVTVYLLVKDIRSKAFSLVLAFILLLIAFLDAYKYFDFTNVISHSEIPLWLIVALFIAFSLYAGMLGVEAVGRFSLVAVVVVLAFVLIAVTTNIKAVEYDFFISQQSEKVDFTDVLKCVDVPVAYALLAPQTADKRGRALLVGNAVPYASAFVVLLMCRAVLGRTAHIYKSPIFALFQLAESGLFTKLDILYISAVLILLLCEAALTVSVIKLSFGRGVSR